MSDEDPAIAGRARQVMQEINACSPGQPLSVVPTLFAFGPIYRALAEVEQARQQAEQQLGGTYAAPGVSELEARLSAAEAGCLAAEQRIDVLRQALVGLVGASTADELDAMEVFLRTTPAPAEDKAASINAIHALRAML